MGLSKPIIISTSAVDTSNLATKSDMTTLQNSVTSALSGVGGAVAKVQRGTVAVTNAIATVTLSGFTDLNKMMVILDGSGYWNNSSWMKGFGNFFVSDLKVNKLSISPMELNGDITASSYPMTISYQVVEFK